MHPLIFQTSAMVRKQTLAIEMMKLSPAPRVIAMAVRTSDLAVLIVDRELGALVTADSPTQLLSFGLGVSDVAGPLAAITLDLPAAILVGHDAMSVSGHWNLLLDALTM